MLRYCILKVSVHHISTSKLDFIISTVYTYLIYILKRMGRSFESCTAFKLILYLYIILVKNSFCDFMRNHFLTLNLADKRIGQPELSSRYTASNWIIESEAKLAIMDLILAMSLLKYIIAIFGFLSLIHSKKHCSFFLNILFQITLYLATKNIKKRI